MREEVRLAFAEWLLGLALTVMPKFHPRTVVLAYLLRSYFERQELP
jgi:hypothetical protein